MKPLLEAYLQKDRSYHYKGIKLIVFKGVFHPGLFFSTQILLDYLKGFNLSGKKILELGAGSGLISIYAAKKGGEVTASDISKRAVENIKKNAQQNQARLSVIESDLFKNIPRIKFDYIIINPPYFKKQPVKEMDYAWYCGENLEYFKNLFSSISGFIHDQSKVIMILSDQCAIDEIKQIAEGESLRLQLIKKYFRFLEMNFLFEIKK